MPRSHALLHPVAGSFDTLSRLSVRHSVFIMALFITYLLTSPKAQASECPSSIHFYRSIGAGDIGIQYSTPFHKTTPLAYPGGTRIPILHGHITTPHLSLRTPLHSIDDLQRLTHDDWVKIKAFYTRVDDIWSAESLLMRSAVAMQLSVLPIDEHYRVIDCYLSTAQPATRR